jgi:PAS domain S-box-containing protein
MAFTDMKTIIGRILVCTLLIAACLCLVPTGTHAGDSPDRPRHILIIPSYNFDYKGIQWFLQGVMAQFAERKTFQIILSLENLQLATHPSDRRYMDTMAASLKIKYSIEKPDLIIVQYKQALQFMERYGEDIFGDVPVVFAGLTLEGYIPDRLPSHYAGITASFSAAKNIELILKNHPNVRKIYIVGGASPVEQSMVNEAISEGAPYRETVEFIALADMTFPALLTTLGKIPDNSVIMYQAMQLDAAGKVLVPAQAAIEIARAARVPVYGMLDTYMGSGITGGFLIHHEGLGRRAADIAMQWLRTGLAPDTRLKSEPIGSYRFDGRQLKRWGIREDSLPAESKIEFKAFSVWDSYKKEITGGVCLILLQAALIIGLLKNRRERIKTTNMLKETERVKSELLGKMNDAQHMAMIGSWEWDLQTNRIWWSNETYRIFGVTPQDFVPGVEANGRFIHPDDFERYGKSFERSFQTGEPLDIDLRVVAGNGLLKYCHALGELINDDSGKPIQFIGTIMDITDRRRKEQELREKEVQYRNLANAGLALIWTSGPDKLCTYFNEPWLKFTGRTLDQELGNGWTEGVHPDDLERCVNIYISAFDQRQSFDMEYRLRHADGEYRWIRDMGTPNYSAGGKFVGYIGHCFDITEQRRAEEEIRKLNENLERMVFERTAELKQTIAQLEETNRVFVGRELKMAELKVRIAELESRIS